MRKLKYWQAISEATVQCMEVDPNEAIVLESVKKTGRLVVADTSWALYGFSAEVAGVAAEKGWEYLKAPVRRVTPPDCPAPVSKPLEEAFHPNPLVIAQACLELVKGEAKARGRMADVQESFHRPY